eukprot:TCALIF_11105-PA protein Name:"Protein of unknown function" AED:0.24 eAED:0.25 QI:0/0.5/0.66/1/0.5/0.33/3/129/100
MLIHPSKSRSIIRAVTSSLYKSPPITTHQYDHSQITNSMVDLFVSFCVALSVSTTLCTVGGILYCLYTSMGSHNSSSSQVYQTICIDDEDIETFMDPDYD